MPDTEALISGGTTTARPQAAVQACIDESVPLFCAGLGNPGFMVESAHTAGMKVLGIAGNARNAGSIAAAGADLVVAQGHEAGGHTGRVGSMALWPQAIDAAAPTPVLAAGGIGDGRGLAAALAVGCSRAAADALRPFVNWDSTSTSSKPTRPQTPAVSTVAHSEAQFLLPNTSKLLDR